MNKSFMTLIFVCMFIFLFANVSAQPPFQTGTFTEGYIIESPTLTPVENSISHNFHAHVYNKSNGLPIGTQASCLFHLYNASGTQFYEKEATFTPPLDFNVIVAGGNFTQNGLYSYIFSCNSSRNGGFILNYFEVTPNGEEPTTAKAFFYIGLLGLLIFFMVIIFWAHMDDTSSLAKFWWFSFMWIPFWAILFIGWSMARDFLTSQGVIEAVLWWGWVVIGIVYPFYLLGLVLYTFYWIYEQKEVQQLVKRGFSLEEAQSRVKGRGRGMAQ